MGELFAGRFEILDPIADGGMGSVWTARDHKHGTTVAVKILRQADAGSLMRFMREQGTRIEHDHVITPISWAGEDDKVLFSMPLVTGGSVATLLGDYGQLPPLYTAEILRQVLAALEAVHAVGVVHRDIKPGNLLLDPTGTGKPYVWLTDFGVATPVDAPRLTQVTHVIGTPGYLAPELMQHADPAPSQDLYALGMMAGQMLTGERPVMGDTVERFTMPEGCPPRLWHLVRALAAPRVADRPPNATEAREFIDAPELAWPAEGQEDIEVFEQVTVGQGLSGRSEEFTPRTHPSRITPASVSGGTGVGPDAPTALGPREGVAQAAAPRPVTPVPGSATPAPHDDTRGVDLTTYQAQKAAEMSPAHRRRGAGALAAMAATFLGVLLLGLAVVMALHPWKSVEEGDSKPFEPKPAASHAADAPNVGDTCEWNMAGTEIASQEDKYVRCTATNDGYKWIYVRWDAPQK